MTAAMAAEPKTSHALVTRIRGEFLELPCLRLTLGQASKLFGAQVDECASALERLVDARFLKPMTDGSFIRLA